MKFESIKSSKFEAFRNSEIIEKMNILGGKLYLTKKGGSSSFNDCWDDKTGRDIHCTDGSSYDTCQG